MNFVKTKNQYIKSDYFILICFALITIIGHVCIINRYGYFLDELYTIACSKHISFGFIDIPPVSPAILALNTFLFGDSLIAVRILPTLVSGIVVFIVGLMTKQIGGGRIAVTLAAVAAMFTPVWRIVYSSYTYDVFDQLLTVCLFYLIILYIKSGNARYWIPIGLVVGIGIMTKPSMLFYIAMLVLAVLLTKSRKDFFTKWPWLGGLLALAILLPAVIWQIKNGYPIAEYWQSYSANKTVNTSTIGYILMQIVFSNLALLPLWIMGAGYLFFHEKGKKYRLLGITFACISLLCIVLKSNFHMLTPAFSVLMASGAISMENVILRKNRRILKTAYIFIIGLVGAVYIVLFTPVLQPQNLEQCYRTIADVTGLVPRNEKIDFPNFLYNRLEWDSYISDMAEVYDSIPVAQRKNTAVLSQNYGYAGAIDLLGKKKGLPDAACGQLNYYLFSMGNMAGKDTFLVSGESVESLSRFFHQVELAKVSKTVYRMPYETPIYICRGLKVSEQELKEALKSFR